LSNFLVCKNTPKFDVFNCFFLKLCSLTEDTGKELNGNGCFFYKKIIIFERVFFRKKYFCNLCLSFSIFDTFWGFDTFSVDKTAIF